MWMIKKENVQEAYIKIYKNEYTIMEKYYTLAKY